MKTTLSAQFKHPRILLDTRKYLVATVGTGLLAVCLLFFIVIPQAMASLELKADTDKQRKTLDTLMRKKRSLDTVSVQEAFAQREIVDVVLPSKKPLLELLTGINTVAGRSQVFFTDFSVAPGEVASDSTQLKTPANTSKQAKKIVKGAYDSMEVRLTVEGSFAQVKQFMVSVEKMAPLSTLTSISLMPKDDRAETVSDDDLVESELTLRTYFFTQSLSATLEAPLPELGDEEREAFAEIGQFFVANYADRTQVIGGGVADLFASEELNRQLQEEIKALEEESQPASEEEEVEPTNVEGDQEPTSESETSEPQPTSEP